MRFVIDQVFPLDAAQLQMVLDHDMRRRVDDLVDEELVLGHSQCLRGDQRAVADHEEDVQKARGDVHERGQQVGEQWVVVPV